MLLTEYIEAKKMKQFYQEGYKEGYKEGRSEERSLPTRLRTPRFR